MTDTVTWHYKGNLVGGVHKEVLVWFYAQSKCLTYIETVRSRSGTVEETGLPRENQHNPTTEFTNVLILGYAP